MKPNRKLLFLFLLLSFTLILTNCTPKKHSSQRQLTPEEQIQYDMVRKKILANFKGASMGNSYPKPHTAEEEQHREPDVSENDMKQILALFNASTQSVQFTRSRDGLIANGSPFNDPEGKIETFGFDYLSGDITYLLNTGYDYKIKYTRYNSDQAPLTIATVTRKGNTWNIKTITGKIFNGKKLIPVSCGFIISRDNAAFYYKPGSKTLNFSPETGFHIAHFQNGDIATTGFILTERNYYNNGGDNLIGVFSSLGNSLGINKKEDYKLVNILTNKSYAIDIPMDGKMANYYSNCTKRNDLINECENLHLIESLYSETGNKNYGHYFWRINWFNTDSGPLLVAVENGLRKLNVTSLITGDKITAFERTLGINSFDSQQDKNGKISLTAKLGFGHETINDLSSFYIQELQHPPTHEN